jgi:hypothetical protein
MAALDQYRLLRLSELVLPAILEVSSSGSGVSLAQLPGILSAVARSSDEGSEELFDFCIRWCEVSEDGGEWSPVDDDVGFADLMRLAVAVIYENLNEYFKLPKYKPTGASPRGVEFTPVHLPDKSDWFWRPVEDRMCKYESLVDGTLKLVDVARMNDIISVREENAARAHAAANSK